MAAERGEPTESFEIAWDLLGPESPLRSAASFWPALLSWRKTNPRQLERAERAMLANVRVPLRQGLITLPNGLVINTIHATRTPNSNGEYHNTPPPLVLLHGFGAGLGFWAANLDAFAEMCDVYAIDLPGFGRSSRPNDIPLSTPEEAERFFVDTLEQWRSRLGLQRFILLGHSMGAYISAVYALQYPQHIAHLILADPWGIPRRPAHEDQRIRGLSLRWRAVLKLVTVFNPLTTIRLAGPLGRGLIKRFRGDILEKWKQVHGDESIVHDYLYHLNAQIPAVGERAFAAMHIPIGWAKVPLCDRLHALAEDIPTTFLYGQWTWMDKHAGTELARRMKGPTKVTLIAEAGHHVYIDNVADFHFEVVDAIVNRTKPATAEERESQSKEV